MILAGGFTHRDLFDAVVEDSMRSLQYFDRGTLGLPADYRLAFREFGLSIGLQAIQKFQNLAGQYPGVFNKPLGRLQTESFSRYVKLSEAINAFWLEDKNRESATWSEHRNINMVMLATSLAPDGYLIGLA